MSFLSEERPTGNFSEGPSYYAHESEEEGFDWQRLVAIVKRRRKLIAITSGTIIFLAVLLVALTPRVYRASSDLLINTQQNSSSQFSSSLPVLSELMDSTETRSQDTEVEILRSAMVQNAAVRLLPDSLKRSISKKDLVDIEPKRLTDIVTINVESRNSNLAIAYANAICEAYKAQNQLNNNSTYVATARYVGKQLETVRKKLDQKRAELRNFKQKSGIVDLETESKARVGHLSELQNTFQETEGDRASAEAQLRVLQGQAAGMSPAEIAPATIVARPVVVQLKQQLTALETQRITALQEYTPRSPEVTALNDQIGALRLRLRTEASTEVGTYTRNINPIRQAIMGNISQTQANVWALQARADALKQNIRSAQQNVEQLPDREFKLSQLEGDLATYQLTFQSLSDKYETLLISQGTPVANARVITPAARALQVKPRVAYTLALAIFGGLIFALALAMTVEAMDNRIYTEESAVQATGLPVLSHVPMINADFNHLLLNSKIEPSRLLESYRMLRTQLSLIASYGHLKTLVLTSSQPGEGKSTVACNLAIALALNGKRVVLADCDLRRPRVHALFQSDNVKGFTTIIANLCTLEEALQDTDVPGLKILPSGPTPPNPPELLDSRAARDLIERLKVDADYLIIDSPPALMIADAQILSTMADGVLLVVSCQEAKRGAVERTCELLSQTGVRIIGMVLNKFSPEQNGVYDYHTYDSYLSPETRKGLPEAEEVASSATRK